MLKLKVPLKVELAQFIGDPRVVEPALRMTFAVPSSEQVPDTRNAD